MRDNNWLNLELDFLLKKYFSDVALTNPIEIKFGREAKYRFGSIKLVKKRFRGFGGLRRLARGEPEKSVITITSMFAKEDIPVGVVRHTIAHELCHYAHGFSSTNKRLFKYPHHGGIIDSELRERKADDLILVFKKWLKEYRAKIIASRKII